MGFVPRIWRLEQQMKTFRTLALAACAGVLATSAFGQRRWDPTPYHYNFRIGVAFPSDGVLTDLDDNWVALGIDYNFGTSVLRTGNSFFSVDYIAPEFTHSGERLWPIMFGNRFFSGAEDEAKSYFLAGLGAIVIDAGDGDWTAGGLLGGGFNLGPNVLLEGRYTFGSKANGINPSAFGIYLGYRF